MSIFNSLGSNYNFTYIIRSLFKKDDGARISLTHFLENKYGGQVELTYKGRQAITKALISCNLPEKSAVAVNAFTCIAVIEAIIEANLTPVFLDCELDTLNFSPDALKKELANTDLKVVIIQNTFGHPCEIESILKICNDNALILLEDLAHCIGTTYKNGVEAGSVGDFAVLSFGQDKVIDSVSGGALIIRNSKFKIKSSKYIREDPSRRDKVYPILTFTIRSTYNIKVGKFLHFAAKHLSLLSNPMKPGDQKSMTDWHSMLALSELIHLDKILKHKKFIAAIYINELHKKYISSYQTKNIELTNHLRFPIYVKNRDALIEKLKKNNIYLSSTWYKNSVTTSKMPHTEKCMQEIVNLPTHINVSPEDAKKIVKIINTF